MTATRTVILAAIGMAVLSCMASKATVIPGGNVAATAPVAPTPEPAPASATPLKQSAADSRVDFASQIRPFLETDCTPCHFEGGKMYGPLPFDRGATIRKLGADKMFTRVQDEQKRALIRAFLAQQDPA